MSSVDLRPSGGKNLMRHKKLAAILALLMAFSLITPASCLGQEKEKKQKADERAEDEPKTDTEKAKRRELELKACGSKEMDFSVRTDKKQHPMPESAPDKAVVVVIRPTMMGQKIQTKLAVDGKWMGVNRGDNYFFFMLDPGEHYFCSKAENESLLVLKLDAGKTYYLQQKMKMGMWKARNQLVLLDDNEGLNGLLRCHLSVSEEKK